MKISKDWLQEYIPGLAVIDNGLIASKLTHSLAEVEEIQNFASDLSKIVVGEITELKKHPSADKLTVCQVNDGTSMRQIVCGANNLEKGLKVAVCLPGGAVYSAEDGQVMQIDDVTLRGVQSSGMICSERELGISDEHEGILHLPNTMEVGSEVDEWLHDCIFDIENKSLTHRGDCFSHYGIARELAALFGLELLERQTEALPAPTDSTPLEIKVETEKAQRFTAITLSNVKVETSPLWLKLALQRIGIKPINNIVDITNYLTHAWGQPMHAYDYQKIKNNQLIVREAKNGEKFQALNEKEYELREGEIVITDGEKIHGLAGIIGGLESEITEKTTDIIVEVANFEATTILQTSRRFGLVTDASIRFSKGVDITCTEALATKASNLILDLAEAEVGSDMLDYYPQKNRPSPQTLVFDMQLISRILGIKIEFDEALRVLESLQIESDVKDQQLNTSQMVNVPVEVQLTIPNWRNDLSIPADIVEEIARIYGYEKITPKLPDVAAQDPGLPTAAIFKRTLKKNILELGFSEVYNYSFISDELQNIFAIDHKKSIHVENAISPELKIVRNHLTPSLAQSAVKNLSKSKDLRLFEIDRIANCADYLSEENIPAQPWWVGLLRSIPTSKDDNSLKQYLEFKGEVDLLLRKLGITSSQIESTEWDKGELPQINTQAFHPFRQSQLKVGGQAVGFLVEVHPQVIDSLTSDEIKVFSCELNIDVLISMEKNWHYQTVYPLDPITRDVNYLLSENTKVGEINQRITTHLQEMETNNVTFSHAISDEFMSDEGRKLTISYEIHPKQKPINSEEASKLITGISDKLTKEFGIKALV